MNERIKELAELADEYTDNEIQMPGEYHPDWHHVRDEKFAELIVRECADIADKAEPYKANDLIKQHFGIEE